MEDWLVFRLRDVASGCRCNVEGLQNTLVLHWDLRGFLKDGDFLKMVEMICSASAARCEGMEVEDWLVFRLPDVASGYRCNVGMIFFGCSMLVRDVDALLCSECTTWWFCIEFQRFF